MSLSSYGVRRERRLGWRRSVEVVVVSRPHSLVELWRRRPDRRRPERRGREPPPDESAESMERVRPPPTDEPSV